MLRVELVLKNSLLHSLVRSGWFRSQFTIKGSFSFIARTSQATTCTYTVTDKCFSQANVINIELRPSPVATAFDVSLFKCFPMHEF